MSSLEGGYPRLSQTESLLHEVGALSNLVSRLIASNNELRDIIDKMGPLKKDVESLKGAVFGDGK